MVSNLMEGRIPVGDDKKGLEVGMHDAAQIDGPMTKAAKKCA